MLKYLITDPLYYTNNPVIFKEILIKALKTNSIDVACFRDKSSSNIQELFSIFIKICNIYKVKKILINSEIKLAKISNISGVHLASHQFREIKIAKDKNLFVIISCHCINDILEAQKYQVDMVTFSPIFNTPNKGKPKGCKTLSEIITKTDIPIIALGGIITQKHIDEIAKTKAIGFASIRYFIQP
jgi:thiamine-phosphate pyrophosphorylase